MNKFTQQQEISTQVAALEQLAFLPAYRRELISFIDLTSLNETDTEEHIAALCHKALSTEEKVAAVCIYPHFVKQAAALLKNSGIKIATVANFPGGAASLEEVFKEIEFCIQGGAEEIDLVFPYQAYLENKREEALSFVSECKKKCTPVLLKVILETSALKDLALIAQAASDVIFAGADFVKTSTGKLAGGASLEAAAAILLAIKKVFPSIKRKVGFKAAGGIREPQQALQYWMLARNVLGAEWVSPATFRIGASQLLDKLLIL